MDPAPERCTVSVHRPVTGRLRIRFPYAKNNRAWLQAQLGGGKHITRNKKLGCWEVARPHLQPLAEALAERFGEVDVWIDHRAATQCDTRCAEAAGDDCACRCLGENHGGAAYQRPWQRVSDTTLVADEGVVRRHMRLTR